MNKEIILAKVKQLWTNEYVRYVTCVIAGSLVTSMFMVSKTTVEEKLSSQKSSYEHTIAQQKEEFTTQFKQVESTFAIEKQSLIQVSTQKESELSTKIATLTTENIQLRTKTRTETVIITKVDGSKEEHVVATTDTESITNKLSQLQQESDQKVIEVTKTLTEQKDKEVAILKETQSKETQVLTTQVDSLKKENESLKTSKKTEIINPKKLGLAGTFNSEMKPGVQVDYTLWGPMFLTGGVEGTSVPTGRVGVGVHF